MLPTHTPLILALSLLPTFLASPPHPSTHVERSQFEIPSTFNPVEDHATNDFIDIQRDVYDNFAGAADSSRLVKRSWGKGWTGKTTLKQAGVSGVGGMQAALLPDGDSIAILDKSENNPLQVSGHSAWGAIYQISTGQVRALDLKTNSFCAGGVFLSNGTLANFGGNPNEGGVEPAAAGNGLQAIRILNPASHASKYVIREYPSRVHLQKARWYATSVRWMDGSAMVWGGMSAGGYNNQQSTNVPSFEWFPSKGAPVYSQFLVDSLNTNLFPAIFTLPNGQLYVVANHLQMFYDVTTKTEYRLPDLPNGVRVNYPSSSASCILPLTIANNWTPEVLFCGGSSANTEVPGSQLSSQVPASNQCIRQVLTSAGVKAGWSIEYMPKARVMPDAILMPTGHVFIVNGGETGVAGYGNVRDEVGASNADHPVFAPILYDPLGAKGKRFGTDFPSSNIERLYHSSATLVPDGRVWISGSNPNDARSETPYVTRYEVEYFSPPYMTQTRPTISSAPPKLKYGGKSTLTIKVPSGTKKVQCILMEHGYSTHGNHMDQRYVELVATLAGNTLTIVGPSTPGLYPPGYGWLYVLADDVPSVGSRVMIGSGQSPPLAY